jgi:hypothetical protein
MKRIAGLVVLPFVIASCSRCGGSNASAVDAAPAALPDAAVAVSPVDAGDEAAAASPAVETSPPIEIALEGAAPIRIQAVGPSLIEVALGDGGPPGSKVEIERHVVSEELRQRDKLERHMGHPNDPAFARHVQSAKPATTYAYRARSAGSSWSAEITVRTAEPGGAPPPPTSFAAKATTPFAVRLTWDADARMVAGFEVEVASEGNDYVRAAIVDSTVREVVHNHRLPKRAYSYRIRSFNGRGVSAQSSIASVTTPERGSVEATRPPPCKPLPTAKAPPTNGIAQEVLEGAGAHPLHNVPEGANGLRRHLFGEYDGCFRDFGVFELQDSAISTVDGYVDEGFPLLRGIAGAGEFSGAQIYTMGFSRGRYTVVDVATFCGSPYPDPDPADPTVGKEGADDLTAFAPPFATCQRDFQR